MSDQHYTLRTRLQHLAAFLIFRDDTAELDRLELRDGTIKQAEQEIAPREQLASEALLELADIAVGDAARLSGARFGRADHRAPVRTSKGRKLRRFKQLTIEQLGAGLDGRKSHAIAELAVVQQWEPIYERGKAICHELGLDPAKTTLEALGKASGEFRRMLDELSA